MIPTQTKFQASFLKAPFGQTACGLRLLFKKCVKRGYGWMMARDRRGWQWAVQVYVPEFGPTFGRLERIL